MRGLFRRNYFELNNEEQQRFKEAKKFYSSKSEDGFAVLDLMKYHDLMPDAGYHFESLFPNNYLTLNYKKHQNVKELFQNFENLVKQENTSERDVLNFISKEESFFILEALFYYFDFGHHGSYLFKEFPLPPHYIVDFLLIGKNSGGYEFVFIEFEHPNNGAVIKNGSLGQSFRKGIQQVQDWDSWIDANFSTLRNVFKLYQNKHLDLPCEFYELDKSRIHFMVVAGKRNEFNDKTYKIKRSSRDNIRLIHYDNLIDVTNFYLIHQHKPNFEK